MAIMAMTPLQSLDSNPDWGQHLMGVGRENPTSGRRTSEVVEDVLILVRP